MWQRIMDTYTKLSEVHIYSHSYQFENNVNKAIFMILYANYMINMLLCKNN